MKLTKEIIIQINEAFQKLDPNSEFEIEIGKMKVGDEKVMIGFPRDNAEFSIDELLKYITEFESLKFQIDKVTSNKITQMPVFSDGKPLEYIINEINFTVTNSDYVIRLVENPLLIGIAATKMNIYDKYALPCTSYIAIEIEYKNEKSKLNENEELNLLKTFLFELSHIADSSIDFNIIHESGAFDDYEEPEKQNIHLNSLPVFSDGMDLYRKALNSTDQEICFLYFYKIIEYYSPIAARINAYESLARKLDSLKYKNPSNRDLTAIVSIADKFRVSISDKELAQSILASSIDIVELFPKLPDEIKKRISKALHFNQNDLGYSTKAEILQSIISTVGNILYSTRNSIVHAKSNYKSDSNECKLSDLFTLNEFLKDACYSIISWNCKLSDHLKIVE